MRALVLILIAASAHSSIIVNRTKGMLNGRPCKCVPVHECDHELNGVDMRNPQLNGWGVLDVRFDEGCESVLERCCVDPHEDGENDRKGCGYRNRDGLDPNASNDSDKDAKFGEFPWLVALYNHKRVYIGVGALIHPQVVITVAHVVRRYTKKTLYIRAGEWDTQSVRETLPHQERTVQEVYMHTGYTMSWPANDVALLRLQEPVVMSSHVDVICLPEQGEDFERATDCVVSGWGQSDSFHSHQYAQVPKKVEMDVVPREPCGDVMRKRLGDLFSLHDSFVCAGGKEGEDACKGDGGAPLICPIGGDRYKLTGLVSWGVGCGRPGIPGAYSSVPFFRRWIDEKMAAWGLGEEGNTV